MTFWLSQAEVALAQVGFVSALIVRARRGDWKGGYDLLSMDDAAGSSKA